MDKIYLKDNYIVTELGGITAVFPKNYSSYSENTTGLMELIGTHCIKKNT